MPSSLDIQIVFPVYLNWLPFYAWTVFPLFFSDPLRLLLYRHSRVTGFLLKGYSLYHYL
jgi:hypothetical protein